MSTAAKYLLDARALFKRLCASEPADDRDAFNCITAFRHLLDAIDAGVAAVDEGTPATVVADLERLRKAAMEMGAAALAAGVVERARIGRL
jgi:hypothetical protein